jgi:hypothetical protein
LERIDLTNSLSEDGYVEGLNSESGRDLSPVIDIVGTALKLITPLRAACEEEPQQDSLEQRWSEDVKELALQLTGLRALTGN